MSSEYEANCRVTPISLNKTSFSLGMFRFHFLGKDNTIYS